MKTREEVEKLKVNWNVDPCWDIELTEGFEEYREELLQYSELMKKKWKEWAVKKNLTDAAFPRPLSSISSEEISSDYPGLTKREFLSAIILQGLLANTSTRDAWPNWGEMCEQAIKGTDILLSEANKPI